MNAHTPNTLTLTTPVPADAAMRRDHDGIRVTTPRVIRAEWLKFRTVRSNLITLSAAIGLTVLLGALFTAFVGDSPGEGPTPNTLDPLRLSLGGITLAQLIIGVLGVVFVASEYSTGLLRTTFSAVTNRWQVLASKTIVAAGASFVAGTIASAVAFLVGGALFTGSAPVPSITDGDVVQAVLGVGVYAAGIAAIGVFLGFILRSTAAGVGLLSFLLLIAPGLSQLLPDSAAELVSTALPSNAGSAFTHLDIGIGSSGATSSAWGGLAVFAIWIVGLGALAAALLRTRDA